MPELPEVETVRRGLQLLVGKNAKIQKFEMTRSDLRFDIPNELRKILPGQSIHRFCRRAKYLLWELDDFVLVSHLGMTGTWREGGNSVPHDHVTISLQDGRRLIYNDPRRFGFIEYYKKNQQNQYPRFSHLGPEPLSKEFTSKGILLKAKSRTIPIKSFIMNQEVVVGVGNIYASEALFLANISPLLPTNELSLKQARHLVASIQKVLTQAIEAGGSTISDFRQAGGSEGYFQNSFNVYGKKDSSCTRCKTKIQHLVLSGRATYFCPKCQT